jgi:hypothetical protein
VLFDFDAFRKCLERVYPTADTSYSIHECAFVFDRYFRRYEEAFHKPHPPIRGTQIVRILEAMPSVGRNEYNDVLSISADEYPDLIERHFATKYGRCDYNINHFFSGKIRFFRWIEGM